jgi:hypothetical protein
MNVAIAAGSLGYDFETEILLSKNTSVFSHSLDQSLTPIVHRTSRDICGAREAIRLPSATAAGHYGLAPENLTTLANLTVSSALSLSKSAK